MQANKKESPALRAPSFLHILCIFCIFILMAAVAGADYVAPYVNKIDSIACCSANVIAEIVTLFEGHDLHTKVLAASFRNAEQVHQVALAGGHAATMRPEMFTELISHPFTDIAVENFTKDWQSQYGKNITESERKIYKLGCKFN